MKNSGSHLGTGATSDELDTALGSLPVQFNYAALLTSFTHTLGYPSNIDPGLQYCAEALGSIHHLNNDMALGVLNCELARGSSGGPWVQPMDTDTGEGPIVSVNSFGYIDQYGDELPGMFGPPLFGNSAKCLFEQAESTVLTALDGAADGTAGVVVDSSVVCINRRNLRASAASPS